MAGPEKHSLTLRGHRTSVTLEPEFWQAFLEIARGRPCSVNALASEIDETRRPEEGLASAIRVYCLQHFKQSGR
ncbi:ribbon-helix-helix domain-containing protein [Paracoccus sp. IB05]|uniref:ribbon-helix-helix domain-containing protein n=1 Tax=Paracoccus sp. IB05 TaxID=2779367 RepID=UPI0018E7C4A2|nr:ribbon-helix-helix domain-containing protein [Paracoccus sp. IB05]MBJ2150778.1 ribbon-helix-helix domain-containing protein [Paracoccus sp. IB05]